MPVSIDRQRGRAVLVDMTAGARVQEVERLKMKTVKNVNVKKLALAGILVAVGIVLKVYPTIYMLQAVVPLVLILFTAFGVGMILSTLAVFFRDLEYLWSVGLMIIMYASAIFYYPERLLNSGFGWILKCNPLYLLIHNFRQAVFGRPMNMKFLAASIVFAIVSVIVGLYFFYKKQDEFILHI